ncbi:hypothetical protein PISMIDRAFT_433393 [Pisolithus microcarpus 441]|uniref:Heterokaryon incompatibility domain-containing protein n=1 Tax=Pisolithus microcarpus 441 TaxID=765257 RepID=A0A0C9YFB8_9AGAM|nr:hypothetical protein PISMIDRAFT_433393 [Pisolithus microcarpus 441]
MRTLRYSRHILILQQFTKMLSQSGAIQVEEIRHPCTKWHVRESRYTFKNSTSGIFVVDTPSFHTDYDFYAKNVMTSWLKSRFTKKCRSGILFFHALAKDPRDLDVLMQRHLDTFATIFPKESTVPSCVYVVPTGNSADLERGQRLSELESVVETSYPNGGRNWHVSAFPGVFQGQTEMAWSAALLLLKDIVETQANEYPGTRRITFKYIPPKIPNGHPGLKDFTDLLFERFKEETTDCSLDAKIILGRVARDLTPTSHPGHVSALIACADLLSERFEKEKSKADLDEVVALRRTAWSSLPPHDPRRQETLVALDICLHKRFKREESVTDLQEIITLRRTTVECTSPPDRCKPLVHLANALHERFQVLRLKSDLEEAIELANDAMALNLPHHPDRALARECLARCLATKLAKGVTRVTDTSYHHSSDVRVIMDIFSEIVADIPPRLLHTPTGTLCGRDAQLSHFLNSPEFTELCLLKSPSEIREKLSFFFRFTMLSHRWGVGEPLLRDIEGKSIYDLEGAGGLAKLQQFCHLSLTHSFSWAWSDTCCIDKDSSAELQEAIGSMFSWYHRSSLTIVYLADVADTGSLADSVWFKRGWTLQELLASKTVLFYTQDWSPYVNSDVTNHKIDPALLEELCKATQISQRHLRKFDPGMEDSRSRLCWASHRHTTRPEDMAYSLFGIFKVQLPILYGETAEDALGRLLAEVISRSGDVSVLDWVGKQSSFNSCFPANLIPYQTHHTRPIPSGPAKRKGLDLEKARKLYSDLARLPLARCVHRRIVLPSIIHPVTAVSVKVSSASPPRYTYQIRASRLSPLEVTLSAKLDEGAGKYVLVRPWHPRSLRPWNGSDDDAIWNLLEQLERPFNALLLERLLHNEYKRIACDCTITACVQDPAGISDGQVLTLEVV